MKPPAVNKRQRFDDSENEERTPKVYKHQRIDESEDEERQGLADYESDGYIPLPLPPLSKEPNRPSNLGKGTRSLTHLISIQSNSTRRSPNKAFESSQAREYENKKRSSNVGTLQ